MFSAQSKRGKELSGKGSTDGDLFFKPLQAKLGVDETGDVYEREADAVADRVIEMQVGKPAEKFFKTSISKVSRKCASCEAEEKINRRESAAGSPEAATQKYLSSLSGGRGLDENERSFFEPKIGYDFSQVKVHTDAAANESARAVNALAYTTGNDIVFASGKYQPGTNEGKRLLAHELTHVVQQKKQKQATIQKQDDDVVRESEEMRDRFREGRRRDLQHIIACNTFHKIRRDCPASTGVRLADILAQMRTQVAANPACLRFFRDRFHLNPDVMFDPSRRPSVTFVPNLGVSGRTRCPEPTCDSPIPSVSIGTANERDNICNSPHLKRVIMHELTHYAHCYNRWGDTGDEATSEQASNICFGTAQQAVDAARRAQAPVQPKLTINQPNDAYEQEADAVADKVMRMGDTNQSETGSGCSG